MAQSQTMPLWSCHSSMYLGLLWTPDSLIHTPAHVKSVSLSKSSVRGRPKDNNSSSLWSQPSPSTVCRDLQPRLHADVLNSPLLWQTRVFNNGCGTATAQWTKGTEVGRLTAFGMGFLTCSLAHYADLATVTGNSPSILWCRTVL